MALIDISRTISPATAVWPGDQDVRWTWTARLDRDNSSVNLGSIQLSTHAGTHVDAPYHVAEEGRTTEDLPLSSFIGPVQVVKVGDSPSIRPEHVEEVNAERVLFKTKASFLPDDEWPDSIVPLGVDTIQRLSADGTVLVGTDAPSVDPLDSTALPAHHGLIEAGIVHLEGLSLKGVPPGHYHLLALPLKIPNGDAAPVRAVLSDSEPG